MLNIRVYCHLMVYITKVKTGNRAHMSKDLKSLKL